MCMRRIISLCVVAMMIAVPVYGATVPDDDSAQYMPWPNQNQEEEQKPAPKPAPKKAPAKKKPAPKKQTPKPAPKKTSAKKPAPARISSLQRAIALMNQERYEQARPYLVKAIQEERNNPNAWYWYGVYHEKTGGYHQAQYFYGKAITIDPTFEPLSRVVYYPNDPEKTPLWDPKRPARVYPVATSSKGVTQVPPNVSKFPTAPNDPQIPKVPVYTPPERDASPLDGDSWSPSVYVPPSPEEINPQTGNYPVYVPPDSEGVTPGNDLAYLQMPMTAPEQLYDEDYGNDRDTIIRADKPLYNPPAPGTQARPQAQVKPKTQQTTQPKAQPKQDSQVRRKATVPENRVIRQSPNKAATTAKAPAKQTRSKQTRKTPPKSQTAPASRDIQPKTQTRQQTQRQQTRQQQQTQTQRQQQRQQEQTPPPEPIEYERPQPQRRQNEYLPPVGQYAPDPGTISDTPIPPVGQGSQN